MLIRRRGVRLSLVLIIVLLVSMLTPAVFAAPAAAPSAKREKDNQGKSDDLKHPLGEKQRALRQKALEMKLKGKATGNVVQVAKGQYVELGREATDKIFVVIAEFGNTRHVAFPDTINGQPASDALVFDGPLHNQIPQPNRANDNTTLWQADYTRAHYEDMYFNRMAKYYESQSSGRYSVEGTVTEWVKVPFNEARYGRDFCGGITCNNTWFLIRDAMSFWVKGQLDAGKTITEIRDYLKTFDAWDRYDADGDGNFDEPDGFIDHFQIVHAGGDQAAGDPQQGSDAIWSHRWYAAVSGGGPNGFPGVNAGQGGVSSGVTIPSNPTGVWVGDYTIQPENGGLGVFAHEYGHDLGLPDLYDTSGNTCGSACENSTGFWTLMSSGANIGDGGPNGIGDAPTDLGAWEKFQLGWLNYEVAFAGQKSEHKVGPAEFNTKQAQGLFVVLPDKQVTVQLGVPFAGSKYYYSGAGDNLDNVMYKAVTINGGTLTAQVRYQIELDWDYAYVVVSTDNGANWTGVPTNLSSNTDPNGQNFGNGITGSSGGNWVALSADLTGVSGNVLIGFRYWTDGAVVEPGFSIDNVSINGGALDGAEADGGWTYAPASGGFRVTTGTEIQTYFHAYLAENRGYRGYDKSLATAYNFGFLNTRPDWVESFPYQNGLLINYWDTSQSDNSTSAHPGEGLILPIDAHPATMRRADGAVWRSRVQTYDSTFGLEATDAITLHFLSAASYHASQPAAPIFNDTRQYWNAQTPTAGVRNPNTGTIVEVRSVSAQGDFMQVQVRPVK